VSLSRALRQLRGAGYTALGWLTPAERLVRRCASYYRPGCCEEGMLGAADAAPDAYSARDGGYEQRDQGEMMAAKRKVTVSLRPQMQRPSPAERRAAQIEKLSSKQAELKQEAAERRLTRGANQDKTTASALRNGAPRRSNAR